MFAKFVNTALKREGFHLKSDQEASVEVILTKLTKIYCNSNLSHTCDGDELTFYRYDNKASYILMYDS